MKNFKELENGKTSSIEETFIDFWEKENIFEKSIEKREKNFVFYDGPATANGFPGLHHMVAKFLKDTFCKYKTMQGFSVIRKVGWDTHGLPVELEVEKELGFKVKADIEKFGIAEFNEKCKESVWKNEKAFNLLTKKMGQFIDLENPYVTYDNNYIETEWWILKKFFDEGLFYEGNKILPYCPRCGTGLASHEVALGYKEVTVDTVIVPMKRKDKDEYFLVWTTTPWTLLSNVAICVNPRDDYVLAESKGYKFILASSLATKVLGEDYKVIETFKGKDLENIEYEQLLPFLSVNKKAFYVTCDDYVTMEDGTGIVHIAPAFGEDDNKVAIKYGLPTLNPVGDDGKYTDGPWKDTLVFDADLEIIKYLKTNDKLFSKQKIIHNYPHCWRCSSPLIYYSKPSFYLEVTKIKDKIISNNNKTNWYPTYVGEKRFANWLENLNDWAISRNRYWGTPLPLWRCKCGHDEMIGSRKELEQKAIEKIDENIELHRPYVDDVHITCKECGEVMSRTMEVIDCWFDSGAMPFAQYHYPFENEEIFNNQFPADFIAEGIDQTRGWFYTLLVIATFIKGESAYKNVLVNDLLLDANGKKMSKSKGNVVEPFKAMEEYGADTIRWYLPYASPIWTPLKFDTEGLKEVHSKFFNPLKNTYNFFVLYANTDNIDINDCNVLFEQREEIDKWLLSKYNKLLKYVSASYEEYDLNKVVRSITDFVSEDLSNWYIRRNRKRFWDSEFNLSKKSVYITTYEVLVGLSKMIAPIIPFLSESMYQKLTLEKSVHLADFPKYDASLINESIEEKMDLVRELISIGRYVREENKVKVRQPLSEVLLDGKNESLIAELTPLIIEELNVKKVTFVKDLSVHMNFVVKPNFKSVGKIFGNKINAFAMELSALDTKEIIKLNNNETIKLTIENETYEIDSNMVDIRVNAKEGMSVGTENNNFVIINTELSEELILEGIARELVSKVQQLRKMKDFNIVDRIKIYYNGDGVFIKCLEIFEEYIKNETLAVEVTAKDEISEKYDLNGHDVFMEIERI